MNLHKGAINAVQLDLVIFLVSDETEVYVPGNDLHNYLLKESCLLHGGPSPLINQWHCVKAYSLALYKSTQACSIFVSYIYIYE